jgi:PPK2 family polyphosphate:nucleotide phosphotransferase
MSENPSMPREVGTINRWRVPFDGSMAESDMKSDSGKPNKGCINRLREARAALQPLQQALYGNKQFSVLIIFQALDAAGKDGTIREVFEKLDPAGISVSAFKKPSKLELAHDFLWRTTLNLPERGRIRIFNRSHYEEVLTVRVHPEFLDAQFPLGAPHPEALWPHRYRAIREYERHLAVSNTLILKFWLNVSPQEQSRRFLDRIEEADKRWKFSARDVYESGFRQAYDEATLDMLNETSRPWAPWFIIPADDKEYMRSQVAEIVLDAMQRLPLSYPQPDVESAAEMEQIRQDLIKRVSD